MKTNTIAHIKQAVIVLLIMSSFGCSNQDSNAGLGEVITTISPSDKINVVVNGTEAVSIVFNSILAPVGNLNININNLPSGWYSQSGNNVTCNKVNNTGNGCLLNLTFHPTNMSQNGTLNLNYSYISYTLNGQSSTKYGSINIPYSVSSVDRIIGRVNPLPPIVAQPSGLQIATITFNSQNNNLTNLQLDLTQLPAGWSTAESNVHTIFDCAVVSHKGNGCQVLLKFSPANLFESGVLILPYTYVNNVGTNVSDRLSIKYTSVNQNSVIANGPYVVSSALFGQKSIIFSFKTDFGVAKNFNINLSKLSILYPGWMSGSGQQYTCTTVNSYNNNCQIILNFEPTLITESGILTLPFTFTNNLNESSSANIVTVYNSILDNSVYTVPNNINIAVPVGLTESTVIYFNVESGSISNFKIALNTLPNGWSVLSNSCGDTISQFSPCSLVLQLNTVGLNPQTSIFQLQYSFTNNANNSESGNIPIQYTIQSDSTVSYSPVNIPTLIAQVGNSVNQTITFTAQGGPVTNFNYNITSSTNDLSIVSGTCVNGMNLATDQECTLVVQFTPKLVNENSYGQLSFNYVDNTNTFNGNTINIPYATASNLSYIRTPSGNISSVPQIAVPVTITFTANNGNISNMSFTPNLPNNWSNTGTTCGTSLLAGQSCTYTITYTPQSNGTNGNFTFNYAYTNSTGSSYIINIPITFSSGQWNSVTNSSAIEINSATLDSNNNLYLGAYSPQNNSSTNVFEYILSSNSWNNVIPNFNGSEAIVTALAVGGGDIFPGVDAALFGGVMWQFPGSITLFQFHNRHPTNAFYYNGVIYYGDSGGNLYSGNTENISLPPTSTVNGEAVDNSNNFYAALGNGSSDGYVFVCLNFNWNNCNQIDSGGSALSMASDPQGNIYVGWASGLLIKYTNNGSQSSTIFTQPNQYPITSLAWDSYHNQLLVGSFSNNTGYVYAITSTGNAVNLNYPSGQNVSVKFYVLADTQGNIYAITYSGYIYILKY